MEGNVQYVAKQVSKFDGKNADYFREWCSKLRVSLSLYSKPIFEVVQVSQRPSDLDNDQATAREGWDDANHNLFSTHNDADCHARPANGLNGNAHFTQVRPASVPGICSSWDFPVGDDSDEKPCISISVREVQPATEPTKA